jgi:hypothetical protein
MIEVKRAIILVSIIGTILAEYKESEITPAIGELRDVCQRFMEKQSGVETVLFTDSRKKRVMKDVVTNKKRHAQFLESVGIGDRVWQGAVDRYASQGVTIDAVSMIMALYDFAPDVLHKHARISRERMEAYANSGTDGDETYKREGAVIGGYITELLAHEMGMKINGRLRALKQKVLRDQEAA